MSKLSKRSRSAEPEPLSTTMDRVEKLLGKYRDSGRFEQDQAIYDAYMLVDRRHDEKHRRCNARNVPKDPAVRRVAVLERPPVTTAVSFVREALGFRRETGRPVLLVLAGLPGCGKTSAGAWAVYQHSDARCRCVYAARISATPDNGWSENRDALREWRDAPLLLVDELGGDHNAAPVSALLTERYNEARTTIVTTNLDMETWSERYLDGRLRSRVVGAQARGAITPAASLRAGGLPWWIDCEKVDYRNDAARAALEGGAQ